MIRLNFRTLALGVICLNLAIPLASPPADAKVHRAFRALIKIIRQPPPTRLLPPRLLEEALQPQQLGEAWRLRGEAVEGARPPSGEHFFESAKAERVEAVRSVVQTFWREHRPPVPRRDQWRSGGQVRVKIEAEGLSHGDLQAIHRDILEVFQTSNVRPVNRLKLTEVNLKDAYLVLEGDRKYVVGFKPLKRAVEVALVVVISVSLGADELAIACAEEDIDEGDPVCEFLTLIAGIVNLMWWDSIGKDAVPTELVLDPPPGVVR